jgi:hypothetical protein
LFTDSLLISSLLVSPFILIILLLNSWIFIWFLPTHLFIFSDWWCVLLHFILVHYM